MSRIQISRQIFGRRPSPESLGHRLPFVDVDLCTWLSFTEGRAAASPWRSFLPSYALASQLVVFTGAQGSMVAVELTMHSARNRVLESNRERCESSRPMSTTQSATARRSRRRLSGQLPGPRLGLQRAWRGTVRGSGRSRRLLATQP